MKPYIAIVSHDPGSAYGVFFPDAPGCFSAADELDSLFANASEALEGWTEAMLDNDFPIPETRDLTELKADPELADDFATAVLVIAIPPPARLAVSRAA
jgi:predicted RNase H-like HicB family nuclease